MNEMIPKASLTRRSFLAGTTGVTVAFALGSAGRAFAAEGGLEPNVFVHIGTDDRIRIYAPAAEMGQGVMTSCPLILAEEMDADWSKVTVEQAPVAPGLGNPGFGNLMVTGASRTTQGYWPLLRRTGAQTRRVLMLSVAAKWGVPVTELSTSPNKVLHAASNRSLSYGEIAAFAVAPEKPPEITDAELKPRDEWRLIGKSVPRVDIPAKVDGSAIYGIDIQRPGMKYASVVRAPVHGSGPETVDDAAALAVPGVEAVLPLPYGVAIVASDFDACLAARDELTVKWKTGAKAANYDSEAVAAEYAAIAADRSREGVIHGTKGDAATAIDGAAKVLGGSFITDHVHHATLEPMTATAHVQGDSAELWISNQAPGIAQFATAGVLKTSPDKVKVNATYLGGGFGRKVEQDATIDAVLISKALGAPVKVIWTREEDVQHDKYRNLTGQHIEAALDADGKLVGWRHRVVADSTIARFRPDAYAKSGGKDEAAVEGGHVFYDIANQELDLVREDRGVDVGFWRAVGVGYTKFAIETVIDEVATELGRDPVDYRLELLKDDPRGAAVLKKAAEMAGWGRTVDGHAFGVAFSDAWNTRIAEVVEIALDRDSGEIRVHNVWAAVDPGVAVQPDTIRAQVEGGIVFGLSAALHEAITIKDGVTQESNFHDYPLLRLSEVPNIEVEILEGADRPGGVGEVSLPPVAPAIANAIATMTGVRLRRLPMRADRVAEALKA